MLFNLKEKSKETEKKAHLNQGFKNLYETLKIKNIPLSCIGLYLSQSSMFV